MYREDLSRKSVSLSDYHMTEDTRSDRPQVNSKPNCRERAVSEFTKHSIPAVEGVQYVDWMVATWVI